MSQLWALNLLLTECLWLTSPTQTTIHKYLSMPDGSVLLNISDGQIPIMISFKSQFERLLQFALNVKDSN